MAEALAAEVTTLVTRRGEVRRVVEALRELSLYGALPPSLALRALIPALAWLRANKKAGEENKAVRAVYQALSATALQGGIERDVAEVAMRQLAADVGDDVVPRQLAALRLYAELAVRFPSVPGA